MKIRKGAVVVLGVVFVASLAYFISYAARFTPAPRGQTFLGEVGEGFGVATLWGLLVLYGRSVLKLLVNEGPWWERILPWVPGDEADSWARRGLRFLNRTHPWVGVATLAGATTHLLLVGPSHANPFLVLAFAVMGWQAAFGAFLRLGFTPRLLRRRAYLVHAQLTTGALITIFAAFGHLLVGE